MTVEEIENIIHAYNAGKKIEGSFGNGWIEIPNDECFIDTLRVVLAGSCKMRVKPEPKYRAYKDEYEFMEACVKHGFFLKNIKSKDLNLGYDSWILPLSIRGYWVNFDKAIAADGVNTDVTLNNMLHNYVWKDGTPCGAIDEEK